MYCKHNPTTVFLYAMLNINTLRLKKLKTIELQMNRAIE